MPAALQCPESALLSYAYCLNPAREASPLLRSSPVPPWWEPSCRKVEEGSCVNRNRTANGIWAWVQALPGVRLLSHPQHARSLAVRDHTFLSQAQLIPATWLQSPTWQRTALYCWKGFWRASPTTCVRGSWDARCSHQSWHMSHL